MEIRVLPSTSPCPAFRQILLFFSSGDGDGAYPSYWGFDDAGQLCCLMTDFRILDT